MNVERPSDAEAERLFQRGLALHVKGQAEQARPLYEQALRLQPDHFGALVNLGNALRRLGRTEAALAAYDRALAVDAENAELRFNRGNALRETGRLAEAIDDYAAASRLRPDLFQAHFNRGHALRDLGRLDEAAAAFRETLRLRPDFAAAHTNLGNVLRRLGQLDEAVASHRRAVASDPNHADAYFNLGNVLLDQGHIEQAAAAYRQAAERKPDQSAWWLQLGLIGTRLGQHAEARTAFHKALSLPPDRPALRRALAALSGPPATEEAARLRGEANALHAKRQFADAAARYRQALQADPLAAESHTGLGVALQALGQSADAESAFRSAIDLAPDHAIAHTNLGLLLDRAGRHEEAGRHLEQAVALQPTLLPGLINLADFYNRVFRLADAVAMAQRAVAIQPDHAGALLLQGNALRDQGRHDEAEALFRRVQELEPDLPAGWANFLFCICSNDRHDPEWVAAQHRAYGNRLRIAAGPTSPHRPTDPDRRLRVGYLSADLRRHPVAFFFEPLLRNHDPKRVETFCYSGGPRADDLTEHLRKLAHHWHEAVPLSDAELDARIRADGIDILVDLGGHTAFSRLAVLARRPAPVQVTYLGYPFSTGLEAVDYLLADAVACPAAEAALYTERVIHLPDGYLSFRPHPELPPVGPLPARCQNHVTFGSFNHAPKLTAATIALRSKVLLAVPKARLVLAAGPFFDEATRRRFLDAFAARGIGADRLELQGPKPMAAYLGAYNRIDIGLDPLPYNGGTTTCESLLMGVPVLTLPGRPMFGRMGSSIMTAVGWPDFIAAHADDFVARAAAWARDLDRLAEVRAGLRQRFLQSPLGNGPGLARKIEAAYRQMWHHACNIVK